MNENLGIDFPVLTLDVADLDRQTAFWCAAFGYEHRGGIGQYHSLVDPTDTLPKLLLPRASKRSVPPASGVAPTSASIG